MVMLTRPLRLVAHARSGDKGSDSNIGVIAYTQEGYRYLAKVLTAECVHHYFQKFRPAETIRYELPNLEAFNFILKGVLAGGGSRSLRFDAQGKSFGQALLEIEIEFPADKFESMIRGSQWTNQ